MWDQNHREGIDNSAQRKHQRMHDGHVSRMIQLESIVERLKPSRFLDKVSPRYDFFGTFLNNLFLFFVDARDFCGVSRCIQQVIGDFYFLLTSFELINIAVNHILNLYFGPIFHWACHRPSVEIVYLQTLQRCWLD